MKKRRLGWREALFILLSAALVVYLMVKEWQKSNHNAELFRTSALQAETLEPLVRNFYQAKGRMPWSLVDRLPDGQRFVDLLHIKRLANINHIDRFFEAIFSELLHRQRQILGGI